MFFIVSLGRIDFLPRIVNTFNKISHSLYVQCKSEEGINFCRTQVKSTFLTILNYYIRYSLGIDRRIYVLDMKFVTNNFLGETIWKMNRVVVESLIGGLIIKTTSKVKHAKFCCSFFLLLRSLFLFFFLFFFFSHSTFFFFRSL